MPRATRKGLSPTIWRLSKSEGHIVLNMRVHSRHKLRTPTPTYLESSVLSPRASMLSAIDSLPSLADRPPVSIEAAIGSGTSQQSGGSQLNGGGGGKRERLRGGGGGTSAAAAAVCQKAMLDVNVVHACWRCVVTPKGSQQSCSFFCQELSTFCDTVTVTSKVQHHPDRRAEKTVPSCNVAPICRGCELEPIHSFNRSDLNRNRNRSRFTQ